MKIPHRPQVEDLVPCVITDIHRGVYFGLIEYTILQTIPDRAQIWDCRHAFQWDTKEGLHSLATHGPGHNAKIGPAVNLRVVKDVSSYIPVSPEALIVWRSAKW